MLLMGKAKIYASHLPMFHSPHDYQAILDIELDKKSLDKYLKSTSPDYFTLVPAIGVLPTMAREGQEFGADLYEGHFERGGRLIATGTARVVKVLLFRKFDPLASKPSSLELFVFGNQTEKFAAHLIQAKPDFDQILQVDSEIQVQCTLPRYRMSL